MVHVRFGSRPAVWAMVAGLAACGGPDTMVMVLLNGNVSEPIFRFEVTATVDGDARSLQVPAAPGPGIFLPTSFTLQIPRDRQGTLQLAVVALDGGDRVIVAGQSEPLALVPGAQHELVILVGSQQDGGVEPDGPADDAGADGDAAVDPPDGEAGDARDGADDGILDAPVEGPGDASDASGDAALDGADAADARPDGVDAVSAG